MYQQYAHIKNQGLGTRIIYDIQIEVHKSDIAQKPKYQII